MRFQHGAAPNENYTEGVTDVPVIVNYRDAVANESNKSWTVPDGEMWKLNFAQINLSTSATVGNRQIEVHIIDADGNIVIGLTAGAVQAANTTRTYSYIQGIFRETAFIDNEIQCPLAVDAYIPAGYSIRFYDNKAISAESDDMTVSFQVKRFKGC